VSTRQLRFYDELGLLAPARADPNTGYRYYTELQLEDLDRIKALKELGFTLKQVKRIVHSAPGSAERDMLLARKAEVERLLAEESQRLGKIDQKIAQLEASTAEAGEALETQAPFAAASSAFTARDNAK